jgi:tetratricopeptide (TPR) repeat protein
MNKNKAFPLLLLGAVLLLVLLSLAACAPAQTPTPTPPVVEPEPTPTPTPGPTPELVENTAQTHLMHGDVYAEQGQWDEAIVEYSKAIEMDPKSAIAYANRAWAYGWKDEFDKAIADCDEAIRLDPDYAIAYSYRGDAYLQLGEYDRTIGDCSKAIELDPDYALAYIKCGDAYFQLRQYDQAIVYFDEGIRLTPESDDVGLAQHLRNIAHLATVWKNEGIIEDVAFREYTLTSGESYYCTAVLTLIPAGTLDNEDTKMTLFDRLRADFPVLVGYDVLVIELFELTKVGFSISSTYSHQLVKCSDREIPESVFSLLTDMVTQDCQRIFTSQ